MRGTAIAFTGVNRIEIVDISIPALHPDEVLIETELTAVSQGTDRAMVAGTYRGVQERYPFIYGYSRVGRVVDVGPAVQGLAAGDRVFVGMAGTRLDPTDGLGEQGGTYTSHGVVHQTDVVRRRPLRIRRRPRSGRSGPSPTRASSRRASTRTRGSSSPDSAPSVSSARCGAVCVARRCGRWIPSPRAASSPPMSRR